MTELYPHNREAYEKVMLAFRSSGRAAVVHATGTGKSYIIEAVAAEFSRVLVIAPNNYVLDEVRKRDIRAEFRTYPGLLSDDFFPEDSYELIVLDEFHRTGAVNWGAKVRELLAANPGAKVLGTTATEIRYLDAQRNMADELFESNVVSRISLPDAWARGILPVPKYVIGLYDMDTLYSDLVRRLETNRFLSESECTEAKDALKRGRLNWESAHGVSSILRNHLPSDIKRMIVFCDRIENIEEVEYRFTQWMMAAGFRTANYTVHYMYGDASADMTEFQNGDIDGVKVLFAIDMLNEGVHVPDVDAVVMLRTTQSRLIQLQQMGRCMNAGSSRTPVIFDLVDNLTSSSELGELQEEYRRKIELGLYVSSNPNPVREFTVFDYVREFRDVVNSINALRPNRTFEERLEDLKAWVEFHGDWPRSNAVDEEEKSLAYFASGHRDHPLLKAFRDEAAVRYGFTIYEKRSILGDFGSHFEAIRDFIDRNGRWPRSASDETENILRAFITRHHGKGEKEFDDFVTEMEETYGLPLEVKHIGKIDKRKRFEDLKAFVERNQRWPGYGGDRDEKALADFATKNRDYPGLPEFRDYVAEKYGITFRRARTSFANSLAELREFVEAHGNWPSPSDTDRDQDRLYVFLREHLNDDEIVRFRKEYAPIVGRDVSYKSVGRVDVAGMSDRLEAFVKSRDKWPSAGKRGRNPDIEERRLALFSKRYADNERVKAIRDEYEAVHGPVMFTFDRDEYYGRLETFARENGRWPQESSEDKDERRLYHFIAKMLRTERDAYEAFRRRVESENTVRKTRKVPYSEHISRAAAFIEKHHRWPSDRSDSAEEKSVCRFLDRNRDKPEVKELMDRCTSYGHRFRQGADRTEDELREFFDANRRMPSKDAEAGTHEAFLFNWYRQHRDCVVVKECLTANAKQERENQEREFLDMLQQVEAYTREHGNWPTHHGTGEEYRLGYFIRKNFREPRIVELKRRLSRELKLKTQFSKADRIADLDAFVAKNGRWPAYDATDKNELSLYNFLLSHKYRDDVADNIRAIAEKYNVPISYSK